MIIPKNIDLSYKQRNPEIYYSEFQRGLMEKSPKELEEIFLKDCLAFEESNQ